MKKKKGFSLIEILLVLGIMLVMFTYKTKEIQQEQLENTAKIVAKQIKEVGDATNAYLVMKYGDITNLKGDGLDCNTSTGTCDLSFSTLKSLNLLPPNFSEKSIFGSPYEIEIKRQGTSPSYMLNGIVIVKGVKNVGVDYTIQILTRTLRYLGVDGGIILDNGKMQGLSNNWYATSSDYPLLKEKTNYIGTAVGSMSGAYYAYLRRDGTLPMTGSLDMGGQDIKNANTIVATSDITSGHQVIVHNSAGDKMALGGFNGNDYEIRMYEGTKNLSIFSPNAKQYTKVLWVSRNTQIQERLGLMGTDPNDIPSDWSGGLRTVDVYADGTVGAGSNQQVNAYLNASGDVYASRNISGNYIHSKTNIDVDNQINSAYVWASGNINSNYIHSNGEVKADQTVSGQYLLSNTVVVLGDTCSPNGIQAHTSSGMPSYCVDGQWQSIGTMTRVVHGYKKAADSLSVSCNDNEVAVGGGGNSYDGVNFTDNDGGHAAPGMDQSQPTSDGSGWTVSGMHPQESNPDNLNAYVICMRKW